MKRNTLLSFLLLSALSAACGGLEELDTDRSLSASRRGDPADLPDLPGEEPPEPPPPPPSPPGLEITTRTTSQISLRWYDNSHNEQNNIIERSPQYYGPWSVAHTAGSTLVGSYGYNDTNVSPDSMYCYRVRAMNEQGSRYSPVQCAWTTATVLHRVGRIQIRIDVADVPDAGTDNGLYVRLNGQEGEHPYGNVTFLNYARDDFQRNSTFTFDLDAVGIGNMADINRIELVKDGLDGVCIRDFTLLVNGVEVFSKTFGDTASTCRWLDDASTAQMTFLVTHHELRNHPLWIGYITPPAQTIMTREELESRLEALMGNVLNGSELHWGHVSGRPVEVTYDSWGGFDVDFDLESTEHNLPNPEVDIDMSFGVRASSSGIEIESLGMHTTVAYGWFWSLVAFLATPVCAPIGVIADADPVWSCDSSLEAYIHNRLKNAIKPIEEHFATGTPCATGTYPRVEVQTNGDLAFFCRSY
jgi:hypothetical protein